MALGNVTRTVEDLGQTVSSLDGRGYKAYKQIAGQYRAADYLLTIDHVQGDPFAEPSRVRVLVPPASAQLPDWAFSDHTQRRASSDYLNRMFAKALARYSSNCGSGKSGLLEILTPGQQVLSRTSLMVSLDGEIEARFRVGLPAGGRRILGHRAREVLTVHIDRAVKDALVEAAIDQARLQTHIHVVEDSVALRSQLSDRGLVAFVATGACLPRASGIDDHPSTAGSVVPFVSPESMRVELDTPNSGKVLGMGIPEGVMLVVGGGYHGKSTLLRAVERGVYDHIPGDGRQRVVTVPGAVKVRAEDGRSVAGVDIANFIDRLPAGEDTQHFMTSNASGSTSQAASISEALEVGASCLLLDEDTCATNFMIRDARMQRLIARDAEPITPFVDRVRQLYDDLGVSSVLVVGGAGDYFDVADCVVGMKAYVPSDLTKESRLIAESMPSKRDLLESEWKPLQVRYVVPRSVDPARGKRDVCIKVRGNDHLEFGRNDVALGAIEQLVEVAQVKGIAQALHWARGREFDGSQTLADALITVTERIAQEGLAVIQSLPTGDLAAFRIYELAAVLGRLRALETRREPV